MVSVRDIEKLFTQSLPLFNALGDETRQRLLLAMIDGERKSVMELTLGMNISRPTVSHHLRILKEAGIVREEKSGREHYYRPQPGHYYDIIKRLIESVDEHMKQEGMA